ncbi:hypothetical protein CR513_17653, partial [Mucuna pruriens]
APELGVQTDRPYTLIAHVIVRGAKDNTKKGGMRKNLRERKKRRREEKSRRERQERRYEEEYYEERRGRRCNESPRQRDTKGFQRDPMDTLKCRIPPFEGDGDVEAYLDREIKVDQVLACFDYDDYEKICAGMVEPVLKGDIIRDEKARIYVSRSHMFVPASCARGLCNKLQCMYQGSKSIEEYHRDMEVAVLRANVLEFNETTMAYFLHELNKDI